MFPKDQKLSCPQLLYSKSTPLSFGSLCEDRLLFPNGKEYTYTSLEGFPRSVLILAQDQQKRFLIHREYRHSAGKVVLGCPGGLVERGEELRETAEREFSEETGYRVEKLKLMGSSFPLPSFYAQRSFLFYGERAQKVSSPNLDKTEILTTLAVEEDVLYRWIVEEKREVDAQLCMILFFYWQFSLKERSATSPAGRE